MFNLNLVKPDPQAATGASGLGHAPGESLAATNGGSGTASGPPPFLVGAASLYWGWQTGHPVLGLLLALILEGARWVPVRWDFSDEDFRRLWTLCSVLLLAALVYAFTSHEGPSAFSRLLDSPGVLHQRRASEVTTETAASVFRWLPVLMLPFAAAHAFSNRGSLTLSTISYLARRHQRRRARAGYPILREPEFHPGYVYFIGCLAGSCMQPASGRSLSWSLACLAALVGWALWPLRSPRYPHWVWMTVMLATAGLSVAGQWGIWSLQRYVGSSSRLGEWLATLRNPGEESDLPFTRISWQGLGPWKASTRIVARLQVLQGPPPDYLRQTSYRFWMPPYWLSGDDARRFTPISETPPDSGVWPLVANATGRAVVRIVTTLPGRKDESRAGLLPLPPRTELLRNFAAFTVERNDLGAVMATGPGLVIYEAVHIGPNAWEAPPDPVQDLAVPPEIVPTLDAVLAQAGLAPGAAWKQARPALARFFAEHFRYRLWQPMPRWMRHNARPLERFLLQSREGHCEYFATATVLLVRRLGIPARYTVGYAVHEGSEDEFVVRGRDAHAWCQVWNEATSQWETFDTTPADWIEIERAQEPAWLWVGDTWSWLRYQLELVWWGHTRLRQYLLWGLTPVLAVLIVQILFRRGRRRSLRPNAQEVQPAGPGQDSEFYELERWLAARALERRSHEPLGAWLRRLGADTQWSAWIPTLQQLLLLHYRYRFDPLGLAPSQRALLREQVRDCLQQLQLRRFQPARFNKP
ncbi:MAG: transglutaminase domain-containing protein [Verrucomicrobiota bacterium]|nr:transglutaminase domain-containing protein [Limisphaera sp.]MDW8381263.1 transglutaminase domain-containing protein [Verrucomicrobiota bacterium]